MNLLLTINQTPFKIPDSDWLRFGILLLVLLAVLETIRLLSRVNRLVLLFCLVVGGTSLMANWVHHRNEPTLLKPLVDMVSPWFPKRVRTLTI